MLFGEWTLNNEGVWFSQNSLPRFPHCVFYARDNDRAVSTFELGDILTGLGLRLAKQGSEWIRAMLILQLSIPYFVRDGYSSKRMDRKREREQL